MKVSKVTALSPADLAIVSAICSLSSLSTLKRFGVKQKYFCLFSYSPTSSTIVVGFNPKLRKILASTSVCSGSVMISAGLPTLGSDQKLNSGRCIKWLNFPTSFSSSGLV